MPAELPGFMATRGWTIERDVAMSDAARELLPPELSRLVQNPDRRIALAAAPESIAVAK